MILLPYFWADPKHTTDSSKTRAVAYSSNTQQGLDAAEAAGLSGRHADASPGAAAVAGDLARPPPCSAFGKERGAAS